MRRYTRAVVLLLVTSLVIGVAPAASGASHSLKATFSVSHSEVVVPDMPGGADVIEDQCGPDWPGWWYEGAGVGTLTVGKKTYEDADFAFDHCSRWVTFDPERLTGRYVGKSEAGEMIISTPGGSLKVEYRGTWVFEGQVPAPYTAELHYSYTFVEGLGDFADTSKGHGQLSMRVGSHIPDIPGAGSLAGSLK